MSTLSLDLDTAKHSVGDSPVLTAALRYASEGWPVLPLCSPSPSGGCLLHTRMPCKSPGKVPLTRHGLKDATQDESAIRAWWKKWPAANIGIATGPASGLAVVDVDGDVGWETFRAFESVHGDLPATLRVLTGRLGSDGTRGTGTHLYFKYPARVLPSKIGHLGVELDIRGEGALVVAPPSVHNSGLEYIWDNAGLADLAEIPGWLVDAALAPKNTGDNRIGASIPNGQRNTSLHSMAGADRRLGMKLEDRETITLVRNHSLLSEPLPDDEARAAARSTERYETVPPKLPWMPLHMADWDGSLVVKSGTPAERGMAACLMIEAWKRQGCLPDNSLLWRIAQAETEAEFESSRSILLDGFERRLIAEQDFVVHLRIAELWRQQASKYTQKVSAGRISAAKRTAKKKKKRA